MTEPTDDEVLALIIEANRLEGRPESEAARTQITRALRLAATIGECYRRRWRFEFHGVSGWTVYPDNAPSWFADELEDAVAGAVRDQAAGK